MNEENTRSIEIVKNTIKSLESEAKTKLEPWEKAIALTLAAGGINPTDFLIEVFSRHETEKAERENPKPQLPKDYREIEKIIHEMLIENTGAHILDSGGLYGRHWERNRKIIDFRETSILEVTVWDDGIVEVLINVFHFLTKTLDRDETCEKLEKELYEFAETPENYDKTWEEIIRKFAKILEKRGFEIWGFWNTYGTDYDLLSQVLQGMTFYDMENDSIYIILQIHNGCDVRGGYTNPRVFKLAVDEYDFYDAMCSYSAECECSSVYVRGPDVWVNGESKSLKHWKPVQKHENAKVWEYKLICEKCGKEIEFHAYLEYL